MSADAVRCAECGEPIDERSDVEYGERKPCPACGSTRRSFSMSSSLNLRFSTSVSAIVERVREELERSVPWTIAVLALVVVGALVGLVVAGPLGIVLALAIGLLGFVLGPRAAKLVRTIERNPL